MKKIMSCLLLFMITGGTQTVAGQTTDNTIVNDNSVWNSLYIQVEDETGIVNIPRRIDTIYMEGDSVVNNKVYKKVFYRMGGDKPDSKHPFFPGLIREESLKTWYIIDGQEQELLLYDFSVELNDIVELYDAPQTENPIVIYRVHAIDFMNINGIPKKKISLTYPDSETIMDIWVENLGSLFNFMTIDQMVGWAKRLLSFYSDGVCLYHDPDYGDEVVDGTSVPKRQQSGFHFFIQSGILNIQFDVSFDGDIRLHETGGKLLYHSHLSNRSQHSINMSEFASGVYLLSLGEDNGKKRFVKINYIK
jgi:hypothetical protein